MSQITKVLQRLNYLRFSCRLRSFSCATEVFSILGCDVSWQIVLTGCDDLYFKIYLCTGNWKHAKITSVDSLFFFEIQNFERVVLSGGSVRKTITKYNNKSDCKMKKMSFTNFNTSENDGNRIWLSDEFIIEGHIILLDNTVEKTIPAPMHKDVTSIQKDLENFFKSKQMTDVSFIFGNDTVHAHKFMLCCRSAVFRKMFESDMKENRTSSVTIVDIEKDVFETFLVFLYTDNLEDREFPTVLALYSVADKYEVKSLQNICCEILVNTMSAETIVLVLSVSHHHNDNNLKEKAVTFICGHFSEVEPTTDWDELLQNNPRIASYVLKQLSSKLVKN